MKFLGAYPIVPLAIMLYIVIVLVSPGPKSYLSQPAPAADAFAQLPLVVTPSKAFQAGLLVASYSLSALAMGLLEVKSAVKSEPYISPPLALAVQLTG